MRSTIRGFAGEVLLPGDEAYDTHREVWNAMVDRRPALIARCASAADVSAAVRFARDRNLEIGIKSGGHSVLGLAVPDGGLMIDLTRMSRVSVDPDTRRARVGGGALLRYLDRAAQAHGLATTAGNVSHTGVGGLTLGGGMGWLARQAGLACDNVVAFTLVSADGQMVRATDTDHDDLFWALRGGGGNFGVVTEFEFRLHPVAGQATEVGLLFDVVDAYEPMRRWRDLLPDAPPSATLTADAVTVDGRPGFNIGYTWVGDPDDARRYLEVMSGIGTPRRTSVTEMTYLELQTSGDEGHHHGLRRYSADHYLSELSDAAIEAFLTRGIGSAAEGVDWSRVAGGGFQALGGAIAEVSDDESAFSHRHALVEFFAGQTWADAAEDDERMASARAFGAAMAPFASGSYVNALSETGEEPLRRAYGVEKLARLAQFKRRYDPENVFHLNQNIVPAP
jgi:FAD/FMN-containing dehydrogenase